VKNAAFLVKFDDSEMRFVRLKFDERLVVWTQILLFAACF
jgi:hypothetical protein